MRICLYDNTLKLCSFADFLTPNKSKYFTTGFIF